MMIEHSPMRRFVTKGMLATFITVLGYPMVRMMMEAAASEEPRQEGVSSWEAPEAFPERVRQWAPVVDQVTRELGVVSDVAGGVDPRVVFLSIIEEESHGNPDAVGASGEIGLMQIMPANFDVISVPYDLRAVPYHNIKVGAGYWHSGALRAFDMGFRGDDLLRQSFAGYNGSHGAMGHPWSPTLTRRVEKYMDTVKRVCATASC